MFKIFFFSILFLIFLGWTRLSQAQIQFEKDTFFTKEGELTITFIGHGTLMLTFQNKVIHIDPWTNLADYHKLPKADLILITHEHADHLDLQAIDLLRKEDTVLVLTEACQKKVGSGLMMKNGDTQTVYGLKITAVPAYNIQHKRDNGKPYHPKEMETVILLILLNLPSILPEILKIFRKWLILGILILPFCL